MTPFQSKLLAAERKHASLDNRVREFTRGLRALQQAIRDSDGLPVGGCLITYDFVVTDGNTGSPVAGATVTLTDSGMVVVATGTTDAGGLVTLLATTPDTYTYTVAFSFYITATDTLASPCGSTVSVPVALAGTYSAFGCPAVPRILYATESYYGTTYTLTHWNSGATPFAFPGLSGCAAGPTQLSMILTDNSGTPRLDFSYLAASVGLCPVNTGSNYVLVDGGSRFGSIVCGTNTITVACLSAGAGVQKFMPASTHYTVTIHP